MIAYIRSRRGVFFLIVILLIASAVFAYAYTYEARKLKQAILNAADKSSAGKISLDLSQVLGKQVQKICIQHQYMVDKSFVKLTKSPAPGFTHDVDQGEYRLWFYFESKKPIQIKFKNTEVMSPKDGNICTELAVIDIQQQEIVFK
jgi:hypothetical protein